MPSHVDASAETTRPEGDPGSVEAELDDLLARIGDGETEPRAAAASKVGRFAILERLGQGGMGTVYAVYDERLDRRVALKVVRGAQTEDAHQRMLREAQALAKLSHPNVVPVFEVGDHDGQLFLAMEFVDGETLAAWRAAAERSWAEIVAHYIQAGRALVAAHAQGIVHRDFKPDNAVVGSDGRVRVLDFGLAARPGTVPGSSGPGSDSGLRKTINAALDSPMTETGAVLGTPAYMAPEQLDGDDVDHRADQFSFCMSLWEAVYGSAAYARCTIVDVVEATELVEPRTSNGPARLRDLLAQGLAHDPERRHPDMATLVSSLATLAKPRPSRWGLRIVVVAVPIGALAGVWGLDAWRERERNRAERQCAARADEAVESLWTAESRAALEAAFGSTTASYAPTSSRTALRWLDEYAQSWRAAHEQTCVHNRVDEDLTQDEVDRVDWCLGQRARRFAALVRALTETGDTALIHVTQDVTRLPRVDACTDMALLARLPAPPHDVVRAEVEAVDSALADVAALQATGEYEAGLTKARTAVADAQRIGREPLVADAQLALGLILRLTDDWDGAEEALSEAYFAAARGGGHTRAFAAAVSLAAVVGGNLDRPSDGLHWAQLAEVAVAQLDPSSTGLLRSQLDSLLGRLALARGEPSVAIEYYESARDRRVELLGARDPHVARLDANLALAAYAASDVVKARELAGRARVALSESLGAGHPDVAAVVGYEAVAAFELQDYAAAERLGAQALEIAEASVGPTHHETADALLRLATFRRQTHPPAAARELYERALEIRRQWYGPESRMVAEAVRGVADTFVDEGNYGRALPKYEEVLRVVEQVVGTQHQSYVWALTSHGEALARAGDRDSAIAQLERALGIQRAFPEPNRAEIRQVEELLAAVRSGEKLD